MLSSQVPAVMRELAASEGFPRISIYLPTHRTFPACEQDPIRLGNARRDIEKQLADVGWTARDTQSLLAKVHAREADRDYWNVQDHGLAVFIEEAGTRWIKLRAAVPDLTVIAKRYHVRPLIRVQRDQPTFYVLAVTEDQARLYAAANEGLEQQTVEDMPDGTGKIRGMTDFDANVGYHTRDRGAHTRDQGAKSGGADAPKYASLGDSPEDYKEVILEHYTRDIANAVDAHLANATGPLVIAALPRTAGRLRDQLADANTLADILTTDPAALSASELHDKARALAKPILDSERAELDERLRAAAGSGEPTYTQNLQDIIQATEAGRVDTIFLDPEAVVWGIYDQARRVVRIDAGPGPENEDLLNLAALRTLGQGGDVRSLPAGLKPSPGQIAALLRY